MADETTEVKEFTERVELPEEPEEDDEVVETPEESEEEPEKEPEPEKEIQTPPESSQEQKEKEPEQKEEPKPVEGETPRERALRLETQRLKGVIRDGKRKQLFTGETPQPKKQELSDEKRKVLEKFNPEEISNLKEALDVLADDMGFVRKDEFQKTSYQDQAKDILDEFLDQHPEYDPSNDKDDVLWKQFQSEYSQYRLPENPKDLMKIFQKIHREILGIKPGSELRKVEAKEEKLKTASQPTAPKKQTKQEDVHRPSTVDRTVAEKILKGFTPEELDDMFP